MIEPQHRNSHLFVIKKRNTSRSCSYRSMGTFNSRHEAVSVAVQKIEDQSDPSDLMQRWENGPDYIFLELPDEQERLASYLKEREAEGVQLRVGIPSS